MGKERVDRFRQKLTRLSFYYFLHTALLQIVSSKVSSRLAFRRFLTYHPASLTPPWRSPEYPLRDFQFHVVFQQFVPSVTPN